MQLKFKDNNMWKTIFEKFHNKDTIGDLILIYNEGKEDEFIYRESVNLDIEETVSHVIKNAKQKLSERNSISKLNKELNNKSKKIVDNLIKRK